MFVRSTQSVAGAGRSREGCALGRLPREARILLKKQLRRILVARALRILRGKGDYPVAAVPPLDAMVHNASTAPQNVWRGCLVSHAAVGPRRAAGAGARGETEG